MVLGDPEKQEEMNGGNDASQDRGNSIEAKEASKEKDEGPPTERTEDESIHTRSSVDTFERAPEVAHAPQTTGSRSSSQRSRRAFKVPRSKRRGLFGRFTLVAEVERPYDYNNSTKWFITGVVALAAAAAPAGSSIFLRKYITCYPIWYLL